MFVVELDDAVGPRRRPDRPHVYVGTTTADSLDSVLRSKRRALVREHGVRLLPHLYRSYHPTTAADAKRQRVKLRTKLMRLGYTVAGDTTVWHVYVIELDDGTERDRPWVYVGETSKTPEQRFEEHRSGARNGRGRLYSTVVRRHGVRLRPDLVLGQKVLFTASDAKAEEAALADRLREAGYEVAGGH